MTALAFTVFDSRGVICGGFDSPVIRPGFFLPVSSTPAGSLGGVEAPLFAEVFTG